MTSEIKVDTISEQTSANGVTIDGLTIKDGNIIGDVALAGTTPTFTIGDGGAEDAALIFDGNAVDYYIALDDSADNLIIGSGSTVGSNSLITIDSDGDFTLDSAGDIVLDSDAANWRFKDAGTSILEIGKPSGAVSLYSAVSDADILFKGNDGGSAITALTLDMSDAGTATFNHDVKLGDDGELVFGAGGDLTIRHDSSNNVSFIEETGSSNFHIRGNQIVLKSQTDNDDFAKFIENGAVELYYSNAKKLETSSSGIDITGGFTATSASTISVTDNSNNLTLPSTDADASEGPNLVLYRNSSSPADNDDLATIDIIGRNDNSQDVTYAQIKAVLLDASDGTEDSRLEFYRMIGGNSSPDLQLNSEGVVLNEGSGDRDFRVESNSNTHMLFVDGGNNAVGIGTSTLDAQVHILKTDSGALLDSNADNLFIEDNTTGMTIGSSNSGEGHIRFSDSDDADVGAIGYFHSDNYMNFRSDANEALRLTTQKVSTGAEDAPDCDNGGLTLDQNANDANILTFKSSDVAHGMTSIAETDTYATIEKTSGTEGGFFLESFSEGITNLMLFGSSTSEQSTRSTSATGPVEIRGKTKSGTNASTMGGDANILIIRNHATTRFIFDSDGDFHADSSSTTFDEYDDAQLARTFDISHGRGVIESKFDKFISYNHEKLAELELVGREEDGTPNHFINVTGMQRLHNGAIWQQYEKHQRLAEAVYEMAKEALGEDKADAILEKHDIKLLN